jgi:transcriptional regulator with XRE-family HTH domain
MRNATKVLAKNLETHLRRLNKTPYRLAQESGISESTISKILTGKDFSPNLETLISLSGALNIELSTLLKGVLSGTTGSETTDTKPGQAKPLKSSTLYDAGDLLLRISNLSPEWRLVVFAVSYQDWSLLRGIEVDLNPAFLAGLKTKT